MKISITYIWASSLLIEFEGARILTDPWFANNLRGLPCLKSPGMKLSDIGKIDYVFASHYHPDHFDKQAIKTLYSRNKNLKVIAPLGLKKQAVFMNAENLAEMAEQDIFRFNSGMVEAVSACHPGGELNYIISINGKNIFFGGDTAFSAAFNKIASRDVKIDLALLPIGGTRILGRKIVMDPKDAFKAACILKSEYLVPIHEGGIWLSVPPLSLHPGRAEHLLKLKGESDLLPKIVVLRNGETFNL